jgi:hypothetical protein
VVGWLFGWLVGLLVGCLLAWVVGWLVDCLVSWLVSPRVFSYFYQHILDVAIDEYHMANTKKLGNISDIIGRMHLKNKQNKYFKILCLLSFRVFRCIFIF